jgi:CDP-diacylglycerol--serine O-phosphatidyltransferase
VPFYSFKDVNFKKSVPFIVVFLIALGFALVAIAPAVAMWPIFLVYVLSGYVIFFMRMAKGKPVKIVSLDE